MTTSDRNGYHAAGGAGTKQTICITTTSSTLMDYFFLSCYHQLPQNKDLPPVQYNHITFLILFMHAGQHFILVWMIHYDDDETD